MDISKHAIARLKSRFSFGYADIQNIFSILNNTRAYTVMTHKKGGKHVRFNYKGKCIIAVINNGMIVTFKFMDKLYKKKKMEKKMTDLSILEKRMSSREIAELTGKQHQHVKRDIKSQLEQQQIDVSIYGRTYKDRQNRNQTEYQLDYNQTMILITGYSVPLRAKVIKRWQELEENKQPYDELSGEELVLAAMELQREKIKTLSIKAQVADEIANSCGLYLPSLVGKMIMGRPNLFCQWLVDERIMYRKGSSSILVPMSPYDQKEKDYFKIKTSVIKGKSTVIQTYFTPKGLCWIQGRYLKKTGMLSLDYSVSVLEV